MSPKSRPRRLALPFLMLISLTACARASSTLEIRRVTAAAADLKIEVPSTVREKCEGAPLPERSRPGQGLDLVDFTIRLKVFGVKQTGQLELCEGKRALGVETMDLHNRYVEKLSRQLDPSLWGRLFGR